MVLVIPSWIIGWFIVIVILTIIASFITLWIRLDYQAKGRLTSRAERKHELVLKTKQYEHELAKANLTTQLEMAKAAQIDLMQYVPRGSVKS